MNYLIFIWRIKWEEKKIEVTLNFENKNGPGWLHDFHSHNKQLTKIKLNIFWWKSKKFIEKKFSDKLIFTENSKSIHERAPCKKAPFNIVDREFYCYFVIFKRFSINYLLSRAYVRCIVIGNDKCVWQLKNKPFPFPLAERKKKYNKHRISIVFIHKQCWHNVNKNHNRSWMVWVYGCFDSVKVEKQQKQTNNAPNKNIHRLKMLMKTTLL